MSTTKDFAASSGLFGAPAPAKPEPEQANPAPKPRTGKKKKGSAPPKQEPGPEQEPSTLEPRKETRAQAKRRIFGKLKAIIDALPDILTNRERRPCNRAADTIAESFADELEVLWRERDGLRKERDALQRKLEQESAARASIDSVEPPTRDELIKIISKALKDSKATGSDIKGLTATLQTLLPELFGGDASSKRPDPVALIQYMTSFGGKSGEDIVQELGGIDFVAAQLTETLKMPVHIGDNGAHKCEYAKTPAKRG